MLTASTPASKIGTGCFNDLLSCNNPEYQKNNCAKVVHMHGSTSLQFGQHPANVPIPPAQNMPKWKHAYSLLLHPDLVLGGVGVYAQYLYFKGQALELTSYSQFPCSDLCKD
jgi:hypothetical protein